MKLQELTQHYQFHDSLIKAIHWDPNARVLEIFIEFCAWMQPDYDDKKPENHPATLHFTDVSQYKGLTGEIDDFSIVEVRWKDGVLYFFILDDFHDKDYELCIQAKDVKMM